MSTRQRLLDAGVKVALRGAFNTMIRDDITYEAELAAGTFHYHFSTLEMFRYELVEYAIKNDILQIVGQAVAVKHNAVDTLSLRKKLEALKSLG